MEEHKQEGAAGVEGTFNYPERHAPAGSPATPTSETTVGVEGLDATKPCAHSSAGGWPLPARCERCKDDRTKCDNGRAAGVGVGGGGQGKEGG
jgi:hypothetical protein